MIPHEESILHNFLVDAMSVSPPGKFTRKVLVVVLIVTLLCKLLILLVLPASIHLPQLLRLSSISMPRESLLISCCPPSKHSPLSCGAAIRRTDKARHQRRQNAEEDEDGLVGTVGEDGRYVGC